MFNRITTTDLQRDFFSRCVTIFKSKKLNVGDKLAELSQQINTVSLLQL